MLLSLFRRVMPARQTVSRRLRPALPVLLVPLVLCGCRQDREKDKLRGDSPIKPLVLNDFTAHPLTDAVTGKPLPVNGTPQIDLSLADVVPGRNAPISAGSLGGGAIGSFNDGGKDYTAKADVYWRLNWIRKEILAGRVPRDLDRILARTRAEIEDTRPDGNSEVASEALTHLEKGLAHLQANETIQAAGVNTAVVPWSSGREAMRQYLAQIGIGPGIRTDVGAADPIAEAAPERKNADALLKSKESGADSEPGIAGRTPDHKSASALALRNLMNDMDDEDDDDLPSARSGVSSSLPLTETQRKVVDLLMTYATHYNASPEEMMRKEWRQAIKAINKLRDQLALANRPENNDGDNTEVMSAVRTGPAASLSGQMDKIFPSTFLSSKGSLGASGDSVSPDVSLDK